jgi:hypothetical protein
LVGEVSYKIHLDGFNLIPYLTGETDKSPRESLIYCTDEQQVAALRYDNWKTVLAGNNASHKHHGRRLPWEGGGFCRIVSRPNDCSIAAGSATIDFRL